jgi:hypothetical protein
MAEIHLEGLSEDQIMDMFGKAYDRMFNVVYNKEISIK